MTRQRKTPKQRAEEQLGVAERMVLKLTAKRAHLQGELNRIMIDLEAAIARRDHAKKHPDLQQNTTTSTPDRSTTT